MPFLVVHVELGRLKRWWFQEFPAGISLSVGSRTFLEFPGTLIPLVCTVVVLEASLHLRFQDEKTGMWKVGA
jgi:hypothetical protein